MSSGRRRVVPWAALAGWLALALGRPAAAPGQAAAEPAPSGPASSGSASGGGLSDADSAVGYIDPALPRNTLRLRFEAAGRDNQPSRAEFFYAKPGLLGGPGPTLPERRIDYEELNTYLEFSPLAGLSGFLEMPVRFLQPDFNPRQAGPGDLNTGLKWAFVQQEGLLTTFQLRTYIPTGAVRRGLGTGHVSLEPAVLLNARLVDMLTLEGELRYWAPVGGTDFAGDVVRYGLGLCYGQRDPDGVWLLPVVEMVGWTVLGGKTVEASSPTDFIVKDASGQTIVNAKAGLRLGLGSQADFYLGYGRALTGDVWYKDVIRAEFRLFY
jgi:hypothetical protein